MTDTDGHFYLGRLLESKRPYTYPPEDLTTHAFVVGMTGSGKTGLCLDLLEEAALNGTPALLIDPKGDITNALLHFPDLAPADFQPWVNEAEARRSGKTVAEMAQATAVAWRNGLAEWDIQPERIQALADSMQFSIYTPGSDAGLKLSILASLTAPELPWEENRELLREQISGTVTALLGLIGMKDIDPVRSREHILLANIFEHNWSQGTDLDLASLIMQTQTPPFNKLGVFDVNTFFPEKDRFELAMLLNNILAAPAFQSWIEGEPLDVQNLLNTPTGKPRHTIFYLAHLPESERMFFVTLLFSAVETWMRGQSGTGSLRALVYFDEIFGYLPPVGNPPSKAHIMRMLKQARAFGVGLVLATQNPADIDYKALSNIGTWFVGKLATDQDKQRLLDGLAGAAEGGLNRRELDKLISTLDKRVFLARNIHDDHPDLFHTRWAMNYLAGPLTREQIPALNELAGANIRPEATPEAEQAPTDNQLPISAHPSPITPEIGVKPIVPRGIAEYFLPVNLTPEQALAASGRDLPPQAKQIGVLYKPLLLAQAHITIRNRKFNVDTAVTHTILTEVADPDGRVRWQGDQIEAVDRDSLKSEPVALAQFDALERPLNDLQTMRKMKQDFVDWLYQHKEVTAKANEPLKIFAGPNMSDEQFRQLCMEAAQPKYQAEARKVSARHERQMEGTRKKLAREERELEEDQAELSHRKKQETLTHAKTAFSLFRRNRIDQSLTKRRQTQKAEAEVKESIDEIDALKRELARLEADKEDELDDVKRKWLAVVDDVTEVGVTPFKKDIDPMLFGVAWLPLHLVQVGDKTGTVPAFAKQEIEYDG